MMDGAWTVQIFTQNIMFVNPSLLIGEEEYQFTELFLLEIASNIKHWIKKPMFDNPHGQFTNISSLAIAQHVQSYTENLHSHRVGWTSK